MLRVRDGDRKAFEELFVKYRKPILNLIYAYVGERARAEDLCQEVFMKVYRVRETYEPKAKFTTWLWTIAKNTAYDAVRKKKEWLATTTPGDSGGSSHDETTSAVHDTLEDPLPTAEQMLIENVDQKRIEHCLGELTPLQREALALRTASELPYEEIAVILKTTQSSIKSLLNRAKTALVECFKGHA